MVTEMLSKPLKRIFATRVPDGRSYSNWQDAFNDLSKILNSTFRDPPSPKEEIASFSHYIASPATVMTFEISLSHDLGFAPKVIQIGSLFPLLPNGSTVPLTSITMIVLASSTNNVTIRFRLTVASAPSTMKVDAHIVLR